MNRTDSIEGVAERSTCVPVDESANKIISRMMRNAYPHPANMLFSITRRVCISCFVYRKDMLLRKYLRTLKAAITSWNTRKTLLFVLKPQQTPMTQEAQITDCMRWMGGWRRFIPFMAFTRMFLPPRDNDPFVAVIIGGVVVRFIRSAVHVPHLSGYRTFHRTFQPTQQQRWRSVSRKIGSMEIWKGFRILCPSCFDKQCVDAYCMSIWARGKHTLQVEEPPPIPFCGWWWWWRAHTWRWSLVNRILCYARSKA